MIYKLGTGKSSLRIIEQIWILYYSLFDYNSIEATVSSSFSVFSTSQTLLSARLSLQDGRQSSGTVDAWIETYVQRLHFAAFPLSAPLSALQLEVGFERLPGWLHLKCGHIKSSARSISHWLWKWSKTERRRRLASKYRPDKYHPYHLQHRHHRGNEVIAIQWEQYSKRAAYLSFPS